MLVRSCYAACNPSDSYGREWHCNCNARPHNHSGPYTSPCDIVGAANITYFYSKCADGCRWENDHWKEAVAQVVGGFWYSTPAQGHCDDPSVVTCRWRELVKVSALVVALVAVLVVLMVLTVFVLVFLAEFVRGRVAG
jgi:hypothetical protein